MEEARPSIAFLHPDLGLGGAPQSRLRTFDTRRIDQNTKRLLSDHERRAGAERLVVDAAVELRRQGAEVRLTLIPQFRYYESQA